MEEKHNASINEKTSIENTKNIVLVVGLGNPGSEYANTYHNAGSLALQFLTDNADFTAASTRSFAFAKLHGKIFIRPLVFMNESGIAVRDALAYFNLKPEQMLIIHDDADIPVGELKIQFGRGAAGHHGIESIINAVGTKDFWRARLGIERKTMFMKRRIRAERYVLKPLSKEHRTLFETAFADIQKALAD